MSPFSRIPAPVWLAALLLAVSGFTFAAEGQEPERLAAMLRQLDPIDRQAESAERLAPPGRARNRFDYRRRDGLPRQSRRLPALRARASQSDLSGEAGGDGGLAVGTEAFREAGAASQEANGLNIWTCEVTGLRKSRRLHGYLLQDPKCLFDDLPPDNPYLALPAGERG
jgi:hypothetical protein